MSLSLVKCSSPLSMETADEDILMSASHSALMHGLGSQNEHSKDDLGDMTFCMSNYAKEALKMMYMMRQVISSILFDLNPIDFP